MGRGAEVEARLRLRLRLCMSVRARGRATTCREEVGLATSDGVCERVYGCVRERA